MKSGFTIIELLIVVAIIAVLSVIGLTVYTGVQKNARDARRRADIESISKAWEQNVSKATPSYPKLDPAWFAASAIPKDPSTAVSYDYSGGVANEDSGGDTYKVCATLEAGGTYCLKNQQ